ncbi:citrate/2-methylcitrate synthase [Aquabacterium sp. J223]|uniref:citrate/2-methylcitrate synthase n=1 Tax=Aquabacterium sp. J223 TaxID=2898431 RepID=UPI0021ADF8DE|nr:citrate/2-methylcitrate synthase [Aquabacterium sp. J223]UUX95285.1 hypothetical protein LRS07_19020 [Aquabacterium sp. J223]
MIDQWGLREVDLHPINQLLSSGIFYNGNVDPIDMTPSPLDASTVMKLLGIKQQTLYAYASRGLLRRSSLPGSKRSLYLREDVERLLAKKRERGRAQSADASVQISGSVSSSITDITPEGHRYRGRDALALALRPGVLENVAELLWTGVLIDEPVVWEVMPLPDNLEAVVASLQHGETPAPILRIMAGVSTALGEAAGAELRSGSTAQLARRMVYAYTGCLAHLKTKGCFVRPREAESIADFALRALGGKQNPSSVAAVNALFICCADYGFSPATLAARVVASTGAGLHACIVAATAGHSGHVLGGGCDRAEDFFVARLSPARVRELVKAAGRGETKLPGFGSVGDPRAKHLLGLAVDVAEPKTLSDLQLLTELMESEAGIPMSLELGLVALARALELPKRSASALWAIGRSVGWVAHVMEQRLTGQMILPSPTHCTG